MPEISRFFGIVIKMFIADHSPPHFHAEYSGHKATFDIKTQELIEGDIPNKQRKLIEAWAIIHVKELMKNFDNLTSANPSWDKIEPLK